MPLCRDNAVRTLNRLGFDVIRFPRPDISPLDVFVHSPSWVGKGSFTRLGPLSSIWSSPITPPTIIKNPTPNITSIQSGLLRGSLGLSVIADVFSALKIGSSSKSVRSVRLEALEPVISSCTQSDLENYVGQGDVDLENATARHFLEGARVYVISEVISSSKLAIEISADSKTEAEAAAKEITQSISSEAKLGTASHLENRITYDSHEPVSFGFASSEIVYDDQYGWVVNFPEKAGKKFLSTAPHETKSILLARENRIRFDDLET